MPTSIVHIIFYCFVGACFIQLLIYWGIFARVAFLSAGPTKEEDVPVSIIICARNEEENLRANLPAILEQNHSNYEVIVVNDASTDNTDEVLGHFKSLYPHLQIRMLHFNEQFPHGKKLGLTVGIKAAQYEWLLFTDADCQPESNNWIQAMQPCFTETKDIVLGYGGFFRQKTLLNNIIRYDNFFIALQYLGFALTGKPYMGIGRNLAYRKSLFFKNKGYSTHLHLFSGDDDLFIHETATSNNTAVALSHEAFTRSHTPSSFRDWIKQKTRHLTTARYYTTSVKLMLGIEIASRILFYITFLVLALSISCFPYIFYIIGFRLINQLIVTKLAMNKLKEKHLLLSSIFYDILLPFVYFIIFVRNFKVQK